MTTATPEFSDLGAVDVDCTSTRSPVLGPAGTIEDAARMPARGNLRCEGDPGERFGSDAEPGFR